MTTSRSDLSQMEFFGSGATPWTVRAFGPVRSSVRSTDPQTSRDVSECDCCKIRWGSQRHLLLSRYAEATDLTDEEAGERSGLIEKRACYWKRCGELRDMKLIEDCGFTRQSSQGHEVIVCRITPLGLGILRDLEQERKRV